MAQTNVGRKAAPVFTHGGGKAARVGAAAQLRRTVLTCLLWEDNFYEDGKSVTDRIKELVPKVDPTAVAELAVEVRTEFGLRHVPLLLARELARTGNRLIVADLLPQIIKRPDEITEFVSIYAATNDGKRAWPAAMKRGLAAAFAKFDTYQLSKYDRKDKPVRLRDAMFLSHAKPLDVPPNKRWTRKERKAHFVALNQGMRIKRAATPQEELFFHVAQDELTQFGTWEDRMSAGEKPFAVFSDLMEKGELGALAFIRNVRKMLESGIDPTTLRMYSTTVGLRGVLPHQLLTAARYNPDLEDMFDAMVLRSCEGMPKLGGRTVILVDVSGSMDDPLSKKTGAPRAPAANARKNSRFSTSRSTTPQVEETKRLDAACAIAIMAREMCDDVVIATFSHALVKVPPRRGMALRDAIIKSQQHAGTWLARAVEALNKLVEYDRIIVITDEQSHDGIANPRKGTAAYVMNVAPYQNGVARASSAWTTISGWSPQVLRYIHFAEQEDVKPVEMMR